MQGQSARQAGDLGAGEVLGSYRVGAKLAIGGMGEIYRAEHIVLGRACAIKVLRPQFSCNPMMVQRFFNEAKAATAIAHPGIIEVYDFGFHSDGRAYLIMELLQGQDLGDRMRARGQLREVDAVALARGIASALAAAHAAGIVHRDLKPDNIFLVSDADLASGERPKVLDFGVAKLNEQLAGDQRKTQTGALMGTPLYMAPEQARAASAIDHRADLYSLGCIMYQMLTGSPPFVGEGAGEIIALQMFTEPEPLSARLQQVSSDLEALVSRLLQKEPSARFDNAQTLITALDQLTASATVVHAIKPKGAARRGSMMLVKQPVVEVRPAPDELTEMSVPQQTKRRPAILLAAALTLVGAAAAVTVASTRQPQSASATPTTITGRDPSTVAGRDPSRRINTTTATVLAAAPLRPPDTVPTGALIWRGSPAVVMLSIDNQVLRPDVAGNFALALDGNRHIVAISAPGYQPQTAEVACTHTQQLNLQLKKSSARPASAGLPQKSTVGPTTGPTTANGSPVETGI